VSERAPCSVVLPTRNRPEKLARCLASVLDALRDGDEVIVVDSASTDPEVARVGRDAGAQVVRCERPGVDRARNAGWQRAAHDAVLFVDDDVVVDAGWADAMVAALAAHPEAGFVTGRIDSLPGSKSTERPVAIKDDEAPARLDADTTGTLGHSASLAVRRVALEHIGGFDEEMGAGARFQSSPEVDLFDRMFAAGWVGWYEPSAQAWHEQWRGRPELLKLDWRYGMGAGARIAKLARTDRKRAKRVAREVVWTHGLRTALGDLRAGYQTGVLLKVAQVAGVAAGLAAALPVPVRNGHYRPRAARSS
jgi:glycosyltransferase involved in cell wall biosynthesis